MPAGFTGVEPLASDHDLEGFDSGSPALDHWLLTWARHSQRVNAARTFAVCEAGTRRVAGFHALVVATAGLDEAPRKLARAARPHVVPVVLLARLAVRSEFQRRKLGSMLLRDAMLRTAQAAEQVGVVALMVHAKDEQASNFYAGFGFMPSPLQPLQMFLPLATIRQAISAAGRD